MIPLFSLEAASREQVISLSRMEIYVRVGDWVEVRKEQDILRTLDARGTLEGIPFMPEMVQFCGRRFQIYKSAHKTCDSISCQSRRLLHTVHLETRCSGEAHGGCQAGCLLYWKEAWLRPVDSLNSTSIVRLAAPTDEEPQSPSYTRDSLRADCVTVEAETIRYRCQATQIREASRSLRWWDMRQYVKDLQSGNVALREMVKSSMNAAWIAMAKIGLWPARLVRGCYEHLRFLWGGAPLPGRVGRIPQGARTPAASLNLVPGELVRVRPIEQIDSTLDYAGRNRGLYCDPEQVPYANRAFPVLRRVDRIISEETGKMLPIKTPTVVLDSVMCQGRYGSCRMFCPRSAYLLWREAWLERTETSVPRTVADSGSAAQSTLPAIADSAVNQRESLLLDKTFSVLTKRKDLSA